MDSEEGKTVLAQGFVARRGNLHLFVVIFFNVGQVFECVMKRVAIHLQMGQKNTRMKNHEFFYLQTEKWKYCFSERLIMHN